MRLNLLTIYTPTHENVKGPSALPYYLLKYRDTDIEVEVYSFNLNEIKEVTIREVEQQLKLKIHVLDLPWWYKVLVRCKLTKLRVFFKYPLFCYIRPSKQLFKKISANTPDLIWRYPDFFIRVSKQLPQYKHVVTGPDCPAVVYFRQLSDATGYKNLLFWMGLAKVAYGAILQTKSDAEENVLYHLVGLNDWRTLKSISPNKQAFFLLHPHYELKENPHIDFSGKKLRILIAGKLDFYMQSGVDELMPVLCNMKSELKGQYEITCIGKGWEKVCAELNAAGISSRHITWVENYIDSISEYDIQLSPITVGGGMKGKVLDAIANGLLVIGTEVALDNIAVRNMDSCIVYKNAIQIPAILESILNHRERYENIARKGMQQARLYHSPQRIAKRFFEIAKQFLRNDESVNVFK